MLAKLKIEILRKAAQFWKIFHEFMISRHEVVFYDVEISL